MQFVQRPLRALFMRAEAVFNHAFGDRLNPLYHLGAITFLLFWLVGATGLVLYAFFDTSVDGAHRSVQAITNAAWGLGGTVRSVHRYASDAMVLTMALHLLRYYAFDRLRGFRWFSWLTGVALLALAYLAGANGYMLPWDRMAQFVTQASFEWLDWLPGFGGRLSRNFIAPENVSNRLFSLLVFIHIGVPLIMLLLMWVHVQRVPKAATQPPRPIAGALLVTLLLLSLVVPVASQGGAADLRSAPATLALDWFLLGLYPLVYVWSAGAVWTLVGAGSLLLVVLPWLPPQRRGDAAVRQMTVHPGATVVRLRPGETLLDAGLRAGLALPYECRNGGCGMCLCTVLQGRVDPGAYQPSALNDAQRRQGQALMCCATALSDIDIEVVAALQEVGHWRGRVAAIERLSDEVIRLMVELPAGERIDFVAGQYLNIVLDDGQRRAYSFAGAPPAEGRFELHVRLIPGGRFTTHVFTAMKVGDALQLEGPFGRFTLSDSERPIVFVAGATGFAPVKSIVEDAFRRGIKRRMRLYWGVRHASDLYLLELARQWQREHANFEVVPVLSEPLPGDAWPGRTGLVHEAILADFPDLRGHEVYVCGSVRMVDAAIPAFLAQGLAADQCFSDAFVPAATPGAAKGAT